MTKTTKPMVRIHNASTNEIVDREMTEAEFTEYQAHNAEIAAMQEAAWASVAAIESKLTALGLTVDDLKALGL
jgi:antitoxin component HigA of HigAB toxin-antitoxin module